MGGFLVAIIFGYLAGSIPFGLLLTRAAGLGDVRLIGSGNIGATNVLRTGNKSIAALTLICDVLKGWLPVFMAGWLLGPLAAILTGFAALAGHIFPLWLGFKGGKGVATTLGILLGWAWPLALIALAAWLGTFVTSRISSISALTAAVVAVLFSLLVPPFEVAVDIPLWRPVLLVAVVVFFTHRANISRLIMGVERPSSFSKIP